MRVKNIQKPENNSTSCFFFLMLYTIAIFIRPQDWVDDPISIPFVGIFLILSLISYLISQPNKTFGLQAGILFCLVITILLSGAMNGWLRGGLDQASLFTIYAFIPFLIFSGALNTTARHNVILLIIILASIFMLINGIDQTFSEDQKGWAGVYIVGDTRITYVGLFNDPNDLAMFFLMNIPLIHYFRQTSSNNAFKLLCHLTAVGMIYGIYLTNSRGGILGLASIVLLAFFFNYGKVKTFFITLGLTPIIIFILSLFRTIDSNESSANGRIEAWYYGVQLFKENIFFGVGKEGFREAHHLTAHNSYVLIMAELGVIGYTLWMSLLILTGYMLYKVFMIKSEASDDNSAIQADIIMAKSLFYSLIAYATTAFFLSRSYVVFLYIFIGMSAALFSRAQREAPLLEIEVNKTSLIRIFGLSVFSLLVLYVIIVILI